MEGGDRVILTSKIITNFCISLVLNLKIYSLNFFERLILLPLFPINSSRAVVTDERMYTSLVFICPCAKCRLIT